MKIIADENISFAGQSFGKLGTVILSPGREINKELIKDADALVVRSVTRVGRELLEGTSVQFVGTATIGTDHIDKEYLSANGITFADAAGCNSNAVKEYVLSGALMAAAHNGKSLKDLSIGIIGVGNIGSKVEAMCNGMGMSVLLNDPPLKRISGDEKYMNIDSLMDCDILTMHVPLNTEGADKTLYLFDENRLNKLKDGTIIINSSRGEVVDNKALNRLIPAKNLTVILDVWENEPKVMPELVDKTFLATPHIAGYSLEGKVNGTVIVFRKLCEYLNREDNWNPAMPAPSEPVIRIKDMMTPQESLFHAVNAVYDIKRDDAEMRKIKTMTDTESARHFDLLRKHYPLRREFQNYTVEILSDNPETEAIMKAAGFKVKILKA